MTRFFKKKRFWILIILPLILFVFLILYYYLTIDPSEKVNQIKTGYFEIKVKDTKAYYYFSKKKPSAWVGINEISRHAVNAIVVSEDSLFYSHDGLDKEQMKLVIEGSILHNKPWRGASTITQQMVKNLMLTNERTLIRKIKEIIIAKQIEKQLTKKKILEVYLNIIEYGPDLYGIKNASYHYFNKHPSQLTPREGAFLAMLLPSPKKYSLSYRQKALTSYASRTIKSILRKLGAAGYISQNDRELAMNTPFSWETAAKGLQKGEDEPSYFDSLFGSDDEIVNENMFPEKDAKGAKQARENKEDRIFENIEKSPDGKKSKSEKEIEEETLENLFEDPSERSSDIPRNPPAAE
ncbi:MAG: transglycosylase domain-containing protein [Oligoflexales bacterium]|nr:transglycosylase domain-containing protein [Oligoflexales bacterium]